MCEIVCFLCHYVCSSNISVQKKIFVMNDVLNQSTKENACNKRRTTVVSLASVFSFLDFFLFDSVYFLKTSLNLCRVFARSSPTPRRIYIVFNKSYLRLLLQNNSKQIKLKYSTRFLNGGRGEAP